MAKTLKRLYGLKEIAINVPDGDIPGLLKAVQAGIKAGTLPASAAKWVSAKNKNKPLVKAIDTDSDDTTKKNKKTGGKKKNRADDDNDSGEGEQIMLPKAWIKDPNEPKSANFQVGGDEEEYSSPFGSMSQHDDEDTIPQFADIDKPVNPFKKKKKSGPSPVGRPWDSNDARSAKKATPTGADWARSMREPGPNGPDDPDDPDLDPSRFKFVDEPKKKFGGSIRNFLDKKPDAKQGMLSRIFKGRDVTRGQK